MILMTSEAKIDSQFFSSPHLNARQHASPTQVPLCAKTAERHHRYKAKIKQFHQNI